MTDDQDSAPLAGDGDALPAKAKGPAARKRPVAGRTGTKTAASATNGKPPGTKSPARTKRRASAAKSSRRRKTVIYRESDNPDEPERIGFLRKHWTSGAYTLEELQQITGLTLRQVEIIAEQEKFPKRVHAKPALSRNRSPWCGKACPGLPRCPERGVMVSRLFGAVEREIGRFERQAQDDAPSADIRVLGALTSTLDKLFALDRDFIATPDAEASRHAPTQPDPLDPYAPEIAQRIRDAIAQALDGIGDKP